MGRLPMSRGTPGSHGVSMRVVIVLTVVVTVFAAAIALWMYWVAGALIGAQV